MASRQLRRVKEPKKRTVMLASFDGPLLDGIGGIDYTCPQCDRVLAKGMGENVVFEVGLLCNTCQTISRFQSMPPGTVVEGVYVRMPGGKYLISALIHTKGAIVIGAADDGELPSFTHKGPPLHSA